MFRIYLFWVEKELNLVIEEKYFEICRSKVHIKTELLNTLEKKNIFALPFKIYLDIYVNIISKSTCLCN